ncbi:MAG: UvrD-helicase domain-containing protein, partial [Planctomycetota bacterium]
MSAAANSKRELYEADQQARDEATRVFEGPFLLEAGAGTGKTATLVARVVSWSIGPGWERAQAALTEGSDVTPERIAGRVLDGIVAITFTEAAAAEMATRVDQGLATIEAGETLLGLPADGIDSSSEEVRERASQRRSSIERLTVCTIHSFCRRLLAENPLELGIDPGFQVDADGSASANLLRQAIEIRLREAFTAKDPDPDHVLLAARGKSPNDLQEALEALLDAGASPNDLAESPWTETAIVELSHRLKALFHEWSEVHAE